MRGILNRQARRRRPELSATQADRDMQRGNPARDCRARVPESHEPQARLDALSTNWVGLAKRAGGNVGRRGTSPTSDPISQSCVVDVRGPE